MSDNSGNVELRDMLMRQRTVLLGEINSESGTEVARRLLILQSQSTDKINLLIDSGGGENSWAYRLCDLIECVITAPVKGIAIGSCNSAATFVMLHCNERIATPKARFIIHSGRMSGITVPLNHTTQTELEHLLAATKISTEQMIRMYMQKMHKSRKEIIALIRRGDQKFNDSISAIEAVKFGLIERIEEKLDIFPEVSPKTI
jgi:ATP-dependent protease ClpP protease subunit